MSKAYSRLFSPLKIKNLTLRNRLVLPGLISNFATENGEVTDQLIAFLQARAQGGVGLIFLESVFVDWSGKGTPREVGIHDDSLIPGLKRLTSAMHEAGAKIMPQLIHCGRQMTSAFSRQPLLAPSAIPDPVVGEMPEEMTVTEIKHMVGQFAQAAKRAQKAGFDGVEIHAGHGYLISEFLSPYANKRTDEYGGGLENRMRFLKEVVESTRGLVGVDYPIACRLNAEEYVAEGIHVEEAAEIAKMLEDLGVDLIDVSVSVKESYHYLSVTSGEPVANQAEMASVIKSKLRIPVVTAGRVITPEIAENILAQEQADLVAVGRGQIADPEFGYKALAEQTAEIVPCLGCNACNARTHRPQIICLMNSAVGRELDQAQAKKADAHALKVGVIGSGIAGLEAAKAAALKGHKVVLLEANGEVGGLLGVLRPRVPGQQELAKGVEYRQELLARLGVEVKLNADVTKELKNAEFDVLYVAEPGGIKPRYQVYEGQYALDILRAQDLSASSYTVVGSGILAAETALYLAGRGKEVTFIYDHPNMIQDAHPTIRYYTRERLVKAGVEMLHEAEITAELLSAYENLVFAHDFDEEVLRERYEGKAAKVVYLGDSYEASALAERVWKAALA
ncbi:FAD-dependent oxidoreductase [Paradesulfitobacterium aromaticivorans]